MDTDPVTYPHIGKTSVLTSMTSQGHKRRAIQGTGLLHSDRVLIQALKGSRGAQIV